MISPRAFLTAAALSLLVAASVLPAASAVPTPQSPCAQGCGSVTVVACVGAFAAGVGPVGTTWTLTYTSPGDTITETSDTVAPAYAGPGFCAIEKPQDTRRSLVVTETR